MKRITNLVLALLQVTTLGITILTLAGFFGKDSYYADQAAHFRLQFLALLLVCLPVFIICRKKIWAITAATGVLINLVLIVPYYIPSEAPAAQGKTVSLLLFNVHVANPDYERTAGYIRNQKPDIIVLQEIDEIWLEALKPALSDFPYQVPVPQYGCFGQVLTSRYPIVSHSILDINPYSPVIAATIDIRGTPVTMIAMHPPNSETQAGFIMRNEFLEKIADHANRVPGPIILIGDFNITGWSYYFRNLLRQTGLRDSRMGFGLQPTWPVNLSLLRITIDHCLMSPEFSVINRIVGPDLGSDHFPVNVILSWNEQ